MIRRFSLFIKIYSIIGIILYPIIILYLYKRRKRGKEDEIYNRFLERFGKSSVARPNGKLIWIHAASVGEANLALTIINLLLQKYNDIKIVLTTGTKTSAILMRDKLPERAFHQYIPIDQLFCINRFLKNMRPNMAIFIESELWPLIIHNTKKTGIDILLINATISEKSFAKWQKHHLLAKDFLDNISLIIAASITDQEKYNKLTASQKVKYYGNIKFASDKLSFDEKKLSILTKQIESRTKWLVASTHEREEEIAIKIHNKLKSKYQDILTIIVPRHPIRLNEVIEVCENSNISYAIRSKNENITKETQIYIADTIGEMGIFYELSDIVLIGGSLLQDKLGGHNPIEPAKQGCAIITGRYMDDFFEIYDEFLKADACFIAYNEDDLFSKIGELFSNEETKQKLINNSFNLTKSNNIVKNLEQDLDYFYKRIN